VDHRGHELPGRHVRRHEQDQGLQQLLLASAHRQDRQHHRHDQALQHRRHERERHARAHSHLREEVHQRRLVEVHQRRRGEAHQRRREQERPHRLEEVHQRQEELRLELVEHRSLLERLLLLPPLLLVRRY